MDERYDAATMERITRYVGLAPSFGFIDLAVIELILQKLESTSKP